MNTQHPSTGPGFPGDPCDADRRRWLLGTAATALAELLPRPLPKGIFLWMSSSMPRRCAAWPMA
mgnify:CR=1 FL=1